MLTRILDKSTLEAIDPITEQAAKWIVLLTADEESERARARTDYETWKQADPRHAAAAAQIENFISQVQNMRQHAGGNTKPTRSALDAVYSLNRRRKRIKRLGTVFVLVILLAVPGWITLQTYSPSYLMADIRTAIGEQEIRILADNTHLTLNSASAVNLSYNQYFRTVELVQGEILVDISKDAEDRPFLVKTTHGSIRALGTRFIVHHTHQATILTMLESEVAVQTAIRLPMDHSIIVRAGQQVQITATHINPIRNIDIHDATDAWKHRRLVIEDWTLPEILDELNRHYLGHIQYDRSRLETIRVSAVLPLNDIDQALQLLAISFPTLRIRTLTPYLVFIDVNR